MGGLLLTNQRNSRQARNSGAQRRKKKTCVDVSSTEVQSTQNTPREKSREVITPPNEAKAYAERAQSRESLPQGIDQRSESKQTSEWRFAAASIAGSSHMNVSPQQCCQDFAVFSDSPTCVIVADGAGSSANSDLASKLVCYSLLTLLESQYLASQLQTLRSRPRSGMTSENLKNCIAACLEASLASYSRVSRIPLGSLQTTVAMAVLVDDHYVYWFAIGDSAIVIKDGDSFECNLEVKDGAENHTFFVGQKSGMNGARSGLYKSIHTISGIACLTDGAHYGLIQAKTNSAAEPLRKLFEKVGDNSINSTVLQDYLANTDVWNHKHFDDRSISIAVPVSTRAQPPDRVQD
jgi:hypothetical protein